MGKEKIRKADDFSREFCNGSCSLIDELTTSLIALPIADGGNGDGTIAIRSIRIARVPQITFFHALDTEP